MTGKEYVKDWVKLCDSCNAVNRYYGSYNDDGVERLVEKAFNDGAASKELEIKELKEQNEKMKCCGNCKFEIDPSHLRTKENVIFCCGCKKLDDTKDNIILTKWELADDRH